MESLIRPPGEERTPPGGLSSRRCRWLSAPARGLLPAFLAGSLLAPTALGAQESRSLALSVGAFNIGDSDSQVEGGFELRVPARLWGLVAAGGVTVTDEGAAYLLAGLRRDFRLAERWRLTPAFGITLFDEGDGKDLGGPLEFRSSIELGFLFDRGSRAALALYHLSNAGIYDLNPGANSLILTYSFPLAATPRSSREDLHPSTWR